MTQRRSVHYFFFGLLLLILSKTSLAQTSIWQIESGDKKIFVGGTIHLLAQSDHPLPAPFHQAYQQSGSIVLETDISATKTAAFQTLTMQAMTFQNGETLQSKLKPETYERLVTFLRSRGMEAASFSMFTPSGISLALTIMEYQRIGLQPEWGVDYYFLGKAQQDNKKILSLETPEEQIEFIRTLGLGQEDLMINYTLRDIDRLPEMFDKLKQAWLTGDLSALNRLALIELRRDFPQVHDDLLVKRNKNWMKRIPDFFNEEKPVTVLVGALHLAGKEGLIAMLKAKGYRVKQLK